MMTSKQVHEALITQTAVTPTEAFAAAETGIYAWFDTDGALAAFYPDGFSPVDRSAPLYVGLAKNDSLCSRIVGTHLAITRRSALRRSLSALLREHLELLPGVVPAAKGKFGLLPEYETKLTDWIMDAGLTVTWVAHESPSTVEKTIIGNLLSPLNYTYATGSPYRRPMYDLRRLIRADAARELSLRRG